MGSGSPADHRRAPWRLFRQSCYTKISPAPNNDDIWQKVLCRDVHLLADALLALDRTDVFHGAECVKNPN